MLVFILHTFYINHFSRLHLVAIVTDTSNVLHNFEIYLLLKRISYIKALISNGTRRYVSCEHITCGIHKVSNTYGSLLATRVHLIWTFSVKDEL